MQASWYELHLSRAEQREAHHTNTTLSVNSHIHASILVALCMSVMLTRIHAQTRTLVESVCGSENERDELRSTGASFLALTKKHTNS